MNKNNAQLSIFILVMVFIVFIVIFLFSISLDTQQRDINSGERRASSGSASFATIQEEFDACLLQTLRKATLISGFRGGYIFNESESGITGDKEKYGPGVFFEDIYNNGEFLSRLGIDISYLREEVLYYHTDRTHRPLTNDTSSSYARSVEYDFESFIEEEFFKCFEREDRSIFEDYNIFVEQSKNEGEIIDVLDDSRVLIHGLGGEIGDSLTVRMGGAEYEGVFEGIAEGNFMIGEFADGTFSSSSFSDAIVRNKDFNFSIDVEIKPESITASVEFPISTTQDTGDSASSLTSFAELDTRFSGLMSLARRVVSAKEADKTIQLRGSTIEEILGSSGVMDGVFMEVTVLEESDSYVQKVLSFIDEDARILGERYLFNVLYENHAPYIDLGELGVCFNIDDDNYDPILNETRICSILTTEDDEIELNLSDVAIDRQLIDNLLIHFDSRNLGTTSSSFEITSDGIVNFESSVQNAYTYDTTVRDLELSRDYRFRFINSFPNNEDNKDAINCLNYVNRYQSSQYYPIEGRFENNLFVRNVGVREELHGYMLNPSTSGNAQLSISSGCIPMADMFSAVYNFEDGTTITRDDVTESVPLTFSSSQDIEIQVLDNENNEMLKDPFKITIYPTGCLGPYNLTIEGHPGEDPEFETSTSCCNMGSLENHVNNPTGTPAGIRTGPTVFDENFDIVMRFRNTFNPTNEIIWDEFGDESTGLSEAKIHATCQGVYPAVIPNIEFKSNTIEENVDEIYLGEFEAYVDGITDKAEVESFSGGGKCSFTGMDREVFTFNLAGGNSFVAGFDTATGLDASEVGNILCSEGPYGRISGGSWTSGSTSWTNQGEWVLMSEVVYCSDSSNNCNDYQITSTQYDDRFCEKYRFNGNNIVSANDNEGDECDTQIVSINVTHEEERFYVCNSGTCDFDYSVIQEK